MDVRIINHAPVSFVYHVVKDGILITDKNSKKGPSLFIYIINWIRLLSKRLFTYYDFTHKSILSLNREK